MVSILEGPEPPLLESPKKSTFITDQDNQLFEEKKDGAVNVAIKVKGEDGSQILEKNALIPL